MSDWVRIQPDSSGKRIDTDEISIGGGDFVYRQRVQISGLNLTDIAEVSGTDPSGTEQALLTREVGAQSPQVVYANGLTIAAGASGNLDSSNISSGKTGKLTGLVVSASVPFKAVLKTVVDDVESANLVVWFASDRGWDWKSPGKNYITVAESAAVGFDGFRINITNLDTNRPADVYASFFYDEV